jgi:mRNA-degrading endonuclease HigB of HigAB toxin-antitoxin module
MLIYSFKLDWINYLFQKIDFYNNDWPTVDFEKYLSNISVQNIKEFYKKFYLIFFINWTFQRIFIKISMGQVS